MSTTRRRFLQSAGLAAALGTAAMPVHAAEDHTIRLALIGCGGRGTGAAVNALSVKNGPIKLVAMADVFDDKLNRSFGNITRRFPNQVDVPDDRKFLGFDAYRRAIDCLRPGDVALFATPPAFRWVHFQYAIEKGVHVFMEKPVTVDGPTTKKMLELADLSEKKNLKVGVGLMVRHCRGRQELLERVQGGEIGDIVSMRAYRMGGRSATCGLKPNSMTELMHQIRQFHSFLWASGGVFSDYYIHQIDECSWIKGDWPVSAHAVGGRHYRDTGVDQNFDSYSVEYAFPDGTRLHFDGRNMGGCHNEFASYAIGAKGTGVISTFMHTPGKVRTYKGHTMKKEDQLWAYPQPEQNPYQLEWDDLIAAIRNDEPYNEVRRGAIASLVTSMGRMAAHSGGIVTYEEALNCEQEFAPDVAHFTDASPAPITPNEKGMYPYPQPGLYGLREYVS